MYSLLESFERAIFPASIAEPEKYPALGESLKHLYPIFLNIYERDSIFKHVKAFLRYLDNGQWYVDVYITSVDRTKIIDERRMVITPEHRMRPEDENYFLKSVRDDWTKYDTDMLHELNIEIKAAAPELNLCEYTKLGKLLLHTYFASFRSGIRELLYKANGMDYIAEYVDIFNDWNPAAFNIEDALGVPIQMLRKMNNSTLVHEVLTAEMERSRANRIYKEFGKNLNNIPELSSLQYRYLDRCLMNPENFDLRVLSALTGKSEDSFYEDDYHYDYTFDSIIDSIIDFVNCCVELKLGLGIGLEIIKKDDAYEFWNAYSALRYVRKNRQDIGKAYGLIRKRMERDYSYDDDIYFIDFPSPSNVVVDIFRESHIMHNCLKHYIDDLLEGDTDIVYIREKKRPNKSLIDVEIRNRVIVQAYCACNRHLSSRQMIFLRNFAIAKQLTQELGA